MDLYDKACLKIAGVMGIAIHSYSLAINDKHFEGIYEDLSEGRLLKGITKSVVPFILPYCISFYARHKAKKETMRKINGLEKRINELETAVKK